MTRSWSSSDCPSTRRPGSYVDYYTFTLTTDTSVRIDLESSVDTYLYLMSGSESWGTDSLYFNDDGGIGLNSRISKDLPAGTYTVAATTYRSASIGSYDLKVAAD